MILDTHSHSSNSKNIRSLRHTELVPNSIQFFSQGIHPWDSEMSIGDDVFRKLQKQASKQNCLAVGECGLDRLKGAPLHFQIEIFTKQLDLANQLNKPVIVHCAKAFNELMAIRKTYSEVKFIVHGFRGKRELYEQLVKANIEVSFGVHLLTDFKLQELLKQITLDKLFLESDEATENEFNKLLKLAAQLKNVSLDTLKEQLASNNKLFFNI